LATLEELLPAGMAPPIHSNVFARYERGVLQVEDSVDAVRNFTHSTKGMKLRQSRMIISLVCIGVLMTPGDTVLNRMLLVAYSSANALLTAGKA